MTGLAALTRWTAEVWIYPTALPATSASFISDYYPSYVNYTIGFNGVSGQVIAGIFDGAWHQTAAQTQSINTWTCWTATYDGANLTLYKNGVAGTPLAWAGTPLSSATEIRIGRRWDSAEQITGQIPIVRLYNRALTSVEIAQNFNAERYRYGI